MNHIWFIANFASYNNLTKILFNAEQGALCEMDFLIYISETCAKKGVEARLWLTVLTHWIKEFYRDFCHLWQFDEKTLFRAKKRALS